MRGIDLGLVVLEFALITVCIVIPYRYLTSSSARLYARSLKDVLGPWAEQILASPVTAASRIRGPLQLTNVRLPRLQLPMSRDEFVAAFEQVVPGLYRKALAILGRQTPVDEWRQFLLELNSQHDKIYEAKEIVGILKALEIPLPSSFDQVNQLDAQQCSKVRSAIWQLFPDVNDLISRYEEFLANMDYATRRRNLRQLTLVASALTLCGNLTLARLLNGATFQSGLLFDTHIFVGLPAVLWHGQWSALLSYVAGCFLPALTIAGIADVLDRKIFAAASKDFRKLQFQPAIESRGKQKPTAGRAKGASAS